MSKENIIPMGEYLLIRPKRESEETGTILRINSETNNNRGIVLAVGDKVNTDKESFQLEKEQIVIYIPGSGVKLTNSEDSDELISVKNIIGVIKGE